MFTHAGLREGKPTSFFCNVINDYGHREAESCGVSDKAAEEVLRQTGKAHVYRCHFGLVDIAVPVMVNGQHIATLYAGQVLKAPPTRDGFIQITKNVARLDYIDLKALEEAYWQVPVATRDDIRTATRILETLADFLANSWLRLTEAVKERRRKDRELQLSRKEFAYLVLECADSEKASLSSDEIGELMRRCGFARAPNRVLVIRPAGGQVDQLGKFSVTRGFAEALQAIEEVCDKLANVAATRLWMTSICVFFNDPKTPLELSRDSSAMRLASRLLRAVRERCDLGVRIGIGNPKDNWMEVAESYREACLAQANSDKAVATYQKPAGSLGDLSRCAEDLCRLMVERKLDEARAAVASLSVRVIRGLSSGQEDIAVAGLFFSSALESMALTARKLGCESCAIARLCEASNEALGRTTSIFEMREDWLHFAGEILQEVERLYVSGKRQKIVERACRMIEYCLERPVPAKLSISEVAAELGISISQFSRTFRRETGHTFEQYVIHTRTELAKRLLLNPLHTVSEVARRCGFSDQSYFARVFRKVAGCSPGQYRDNPLVENRIHPASTKVPVKAVDSLSL